MTSDEESASSDSVENGEKGNSSSVSKEAGDADLDERAAGVADDAGSEATVAAGRRGRRPRCCVCGCQPVRLSALLTGEAMRVTAHTLEGGDVAFEAGHAPFLGRWWCTVGT